MIEQVIYGVLTGAVYAVAGWQSKTKPSEQKLAWGKLGKSVLICGIVGAIAGYTGQDFNALIIGGLGVGTTKIISLVTDLIKAKFSKKVI